MPEIKANEQLPDRPVVILIFGDPGIGKTSLFNTSENPYLIDFDRGVSRSINRKDTLAPDNWEEVLAFEKKGRFKECGTLGLDTAKACLDDFLMSYVVALDYKNQKNKQAAYGAMGDHFKVFVNNRRSDRVDLIILAHSKDKEDGEFTKKIPDVTGGSYQLLLRIADQVGFMTMVNNKRTIQFEPTDKSIGKNVARLPLIEIPAEGDPKLKTFMADIIRIVKASITSQSEEQREASEKSDRYQADIAGCETPDCLTTILEEVNTLPDFLKVPLRKVIQEKAKEKGWVANVTTKRYELPAGEAGAKPVATTPATGAKPDAKETPAVTEKDPADISTPPDGRYAAFGNLGMALEVDRVSGFGIFFEYDDIEEWSEEEYMEHLAQAGEVKKTWKPKRGSRAAAGATR